LNILMNRGDTLNRQTIEKGIENKGDYVKIDQ